MSNRAWMRVLYGALAVLNAVLLALYGEIMAGRVPFPPQYTWLAPIAAAGLMAATALLPRVSDLTGERRP